MRVVLRGTTDGLARIVDDHVEPCELLLDPFAEEFQRRQVTKVDSVALQSRDPIIAICRKNKRPKEESVLDSTASIQHFFFADVSF